MCVCVCVICASTYYIHICNAERSPLTMVCTYSYIFISYAAHGTYNITNCITWSSHTVVKPIVYLCTFSITVHLVDVNIASLKTTEATLDAFHDVMSGQSKCVSITLVHCSTKFSCYNKFLPQVGRLLSKPCANDLLRQTILVDICSVNEVPSSCNKLI